MFTDLYMCSFLYDQLFLVIHGYLLFHTLLYNLLEKDLEVMTGTCGIFYYSHTFAPIVPSLSSLIQTTVSHDGRGEQCSNPLLNYYIIYGNQSEKKETKIYCQT